MPVKRERNQSTQSSQKSAAKKIKLEADHTAYITAVSAINRLDKNHTNYVAELMLICDQYTTAYKNNQLSAAKVAILNTLYNHALGVHSFKLL